MRARTLLMDAGCAVRTGKYRPGDECRAGLAPPDEVHASFADFVDALLGGAQAL